MSSPSRSRNALLLTSTLAAAALSADAAPGDLDPFFNNTGWTTFTADSSNGARGLAVQPDGRIVVTGASKEGEAYRLAVLRFHADGSPDTGFNVTGKFVLPSFGYYLTIGLQTLVQSDGKILVSGGSMVEGTFHSSHLLLRLLPDGLPDPSFGSGGQGWMTGGGTTFAHSMALESDGRILLAGSTGYFTRHSATGALQETFGSGNESGISSIALQSDGKILCALNNSTDLIRRMLHNGTLDPEFGSPAGTVTLNAFPPGITASRVSVLADGKILVAGGHKDGTGNTGVFVTRILPNGTPDPAFGTGDHGPGLTVKYAGPETALWPFGLNVDSHGRILVAASATGVYTGFNDLVLARFTAAGVPDILFGTEGLVVTDLGITNEGFLNAVLLPEQKLLLPGVIRPSLPTPENYKDGLLVQCTVKSESLAVEYPAGVKIAPRPGAALDFGPVTGGSAVKLVSLRNDGDVPLTGLTVSLTNESRPGDFQVTVPAPSLNRGATSNIVVSLTPPASPGNSTATLRIAGGTPGLDPVDILLTGSGATPRQVWRITWFGSPDNSGPGADLNDFDGDGLENFMEYATGGNPHRPGPAPARVEPGDVFTYTRAETALSEFSWHPEIADSPADPWSAAGLTSVVLTTEGGLQTVRVTPETNAPRRFFRLRVTEQ